MELGIDRVLQQGVTAHREGKLEDAERIYQSILQSQPLHPLANHNLGVIAVSVNKADAAIPLFKTAVDANPTIEQFWVSYIDALVEVNCLKDVKQAIKKARKKGIDTKKLIGLISKSKAKSAAKEPSHQQLTSLLDHFNNGRFGDAEKLAISITKEFPQHEYAWKILGAVLGVTGRKSEAVNAKRTAVALSPQDAAAHSNLGNTLKELGKLDEALECYSKAISLKPDYVEGHSYLGNTLRELGRLDEAVASLRQAIELKPDCAESHYNLGITFEELGKFEKAGASYNRAIELKPYYAEAYNNRGAALEELDRLNEAEASLRRAIELKPGYVKAYSNLGNTLKKLGRLNEAEASLRQAIALDPDSVEAHNNLGATLEKLGRLNEAEASYKQAITLRPDYSIAYYNLGTTLRELGRSVESEASLRQAIELKPDYAEAHNNLGVTLEKLGKLDEAEASLRQAIELNPGSVEAHNNLGNTLRELGRFDEAEASLRQAIELKPDYAEARDNLLFMLNYAHRLSPAELYREYEAYGAFVSSKTEQSFDHSNRPSVAGRRIRVGYSSPDFRDHVCRFFMEPIFREHDRDQFELFAYSNTKNPDHHTERLKGYFDHWIDVTQLSDETMAQHIYDDGIDILVDMSGHTEGNRLLVFAMCPAPIQVGSAIGYCHTTGLNEMDYFIGDENLTPEGSEPYFSEQLIRLQAPF